MTQTGVYPMAHTGAYPMAHTGAYPMAQAGVGHSEGINGTKFNNYDMA